MRQRIPPRLMAAIKLYEAKLAELEALSNEVNRRIHSGDPADAALLEREERARDALTSARRDAFAEWGAVKTAFPQRRDEK